MMRLLQVCLILGVLLLLDPGLLALAGTMGKMQTLVAGPRFFSGGTAGTGAAPGAAAPRVRFNPKKIRHRPNSTSRAKASLKAGLDDPPRGTKKRQGSTSTRKPGDSLYTASMTTFSSESRVQVKRDRKKVEAIKKKVEPTLLYKPKYPAYPEFKMCNLADFDVSRGGKLGKGGFGNVFLGRHRQTSTPVAIKLIGRQSIQKSPKHVEYEETIHGRLYHPFIAKFYCTMADEATSDIYFALQYIPGNNLAKHIGMHHPIKNGHIQRWMAQIILALEYLHDQCIVYRDMKAENVIIDDAGNAMLIDFGLSVFDCHRKLKNVAGTLEYTSPQMARRDFHGREVDYYGLGILLYTIKAGRLPFSFKASGKDKKGFLEFLAGEPNIPSTGDRVIDDLISHLSDTDADRRWGVSSTSRQKLRAHPFFTGFNWNGLEEQVRRIKQYQPLVNTVDNEEDALQDAIPLNEYIKSGDFLKKIAPAK